MASPNLADKSWVTDQYDRYVMGNTTLAMPDDAGMIRVDDSTSLGLALATRRQRPLHALDPYFGAQLALGEAYRNVAASGAVPLAITDCLNFGSPEDPEVMWQFTEAIRGIADGCVALGIPVTGGNVSFYNQTGSTPINPTPVIGVLGVISDVRLRRSIAFGADNEQIFLLGVTREEFGGSEWAHVTHGHLGGRPPLVDFDAEIALASLLHEAVGVVSAAHDLSDGGLAQALVESCLRGGRGAHVALPADVEPFVSLFSESAARALVSVPADRVGQLTSLAAAHGVPLTALGTTGGEILDIAGQFAVDVAALRAAAVGTFAALFG